VLLQAWRPVRGVEPSPLTEELCRRYQLTLPQLALAWVCGEEGVCALTATTDPNHLTQNLAALDVTLSREDRNHLKTELPDISYTSRVPLS